MTDKSFWGLAKIKQDEMMSLMTLQTKQLLTDLLHARDYDAICELASTKKSVMTKLLARTYDPDETIRWAAVESLARASSFWVETDLPFIKEFCRRLLWSLNDESGNMGWFAPQTLGAILAENHDALADFLPLLLSVLDGDNEPAITCGTLWAVGRIGPIHNEFTVSASKKIKRYLNSNNPEIQRQAIETLHQLAIAAN